MAVEQKKRDNEFGAFAEAKAAEYYTARGYAIRERNWRWHKVEIDLIVQEGTTMVFVEVKARSGRDTDPLEAVTMEKMKRITRGADVYLRSQKEDFEYRFDIFTLTGDFQGYETECYEDAFISPLFSR